MRANPALGGRRGSGVDQHRQADGVAGRLSKHSQNEALARPEGVPVSQPGGSTIRYSTRSAIEFWGPFHPASGSMASSGDGKSGGLDPGGLDTAARSPNVTVAVTAGQQPARNRRWNYPPDQSGRADRIGLRRRGRIGPRA